VADARTEELRRDLEDALALVADEAPMQFAAMRARLGGNDAVVRVGAAAPLRLSVAGDPPWVAPWPESAAPGAVDLALSEGELGRLLRGESSIEDGIFDGTLSVRGALGDLLAFFDGLSSWLHGALRSPSLPKLHERCLAENAGASSGPTAGQKGTPS
jgi:hypothetical protein